MANEEEIESFHISEQDLYDAFQPGQRRGFKMSKNDQIYGVFNYEENGDRPSSSTDRFSKGGKSNAKTKDYTAPVGFVKGGVHQVGKKKDMTVKETKQNLVNVSESDEEEGGEELSVEDEAIIESLKRKQASKNSIGNFKDGLGQPKKDKMKNRYFMKPESLGEWEKHTKGIGAKLLMQMGYEPGKGLGKSLQGRAAPVEVQLRKGRGAIGAYGSEHKNQAVNLLNTDEEEKELFLQGLDHWKGDGSEQSKAKKKTMYVYRTSGEVIEEAAKGGVHKMVRDYSELSKVKVIDMTGREQRVLSNYSALSAKKISEPIDEESANYAGKDKLQLDKLVCNLYNLVDYCEHEIIQNAKELSYNKDQILAMENHTKNLGMSVSKEKKQIETLELMMQLLDQLEKRRNAGDLDVESAFEQFSNMERQYPEEYDGNDMANVALSYLIPLFKTLLVHSWRPFESRETDNTCRRAFHLWRHLLEGRVAVRRNTCKSDGYIDPYDGLLWHAWMPAFRSLVGQWHCKNAVPMVDLVDAWLSILPDWIIENIMDQLVLPKIHREVDVWNPLTDMVPIHAWIHPWLPRLSSRLEVVYPTIRQKMAQALVNWEPSDRSAISVLLPWVPVFSKGSMDAFLVKNILPKLQNAMSNWKINPGQQQLDVWNWVLEWKDLIPMVSMVSLLEKYFFPKWLQVLVTWLNNAPNYEEIAVWYTGWKSLFPVELVQQSAIKELFTRALELMNRSLAAGGQVAATVPRPTLQPAPIMAPLLAAPIQMMVSTEPLVPQGSRELVEYRCQQLGILFIPLANRFQAGRQIFRVGQLLVYFDRQVAFVLTPNAAWIPVSAQQLIEMAVC